MSNNLQQTVSDDESSLAHQFSNAESVVNDLNEGTRTIPKEKLDKCIETLKSLKSLVETMDLMSANETVEDLPTSSLEYLLVDAYLAVAIENSNVPIDMRASILEHCQKLYKGFLLNADIFGYNPVPSETKRDNDSDKPPSLVQEAQTRQRKLEIFGMAEKLESELGTLSLEHRRGGDDAVQRELAIKKLQLWCIRSARNLEFISRELQMLEHRRKMASSNPATQNNQGKQRPLKTFVIPKADAKKNVFGLGYPSAPTQTVNEWYDQMTESGRFPSASNSAATNQTAHKPVDDDEKNDEDEDTNNEEARKKRIAKDEYLDTHRKGWGNTHGKG